MNYNRSINENATPLDRAEHIFENCPHCDGEAPHGNGSLHTEDKTEVGCDIFAKNVPLAMAYVPMQKWDKLYSAEEGFCRGTLFCELDFPFIGCRTGGYGR